MAIVFVPHDPFPDGWREGLEEPFSSEGLAVRPGAPGWEAAACMAMVRGVAGVLPKLKNLKLGSSAGVGLG